MFHRASDKHMILAEGRFKPRDRSLESDVRLIAPVLPLENQS
jgi:hypothetical protein